jgi:hypothetical protein
MIKQQLAIISLAFWLSIVSIFMLIAKEGDIETFFIFYLIGIIVIVFLIQPDHIIPRYIRYIWYLIAAGIVIFGVIIIQKFMEIFVK